MGLVVVRLSTALYGCEMGPFPRCGHGLLKKDIIVLGNALVDMHAKCGALEKAENTFNKLKAWNIVNCNVLITG